MSDGCRQVPRDEVFFKIILTAVKNKNLFDICDLASEKEITALRSGIIDLIQFRICFLEKKKIIFRKEA